MTVGDLKEAIKEIDDKMELVLELHGNQHDVFEVGLSKYSSGGMFKFLDDPDMDVDDQEDDAYINFMISG